MTDDKKQSLLEELRKIFNRLMPGGTPRTGQLEAAAEVIEAFESGKKHVVAELPTGFGKSIFAMVIAEYFKKPEADGFEERRTILTTVTKELQNQYLKQFPKVIDIRSSGDEKYRCEAGFLRSELECKVESQKKKCNNRKDCPYRAAMKAWFDAPIAMTNAQFFMRMPEPNRPHVVIMDECHAVGSAIVGQIELDLGEIDMLKVQSMVIDEKAMDIFVENYRKVIKAIDELPQDYVGQMFDLEPAAQAFQILDAAIARAEKHPYKLTVSSQLRAAHRHSCSVAGKLQQLFKLSGGLVVKTNARELKPVYPADYADEMIYSKGRHFLHMSATICGFEAYCKEMGIPADSAIFISAPHVIPKERREIYGDYAASMKHSNYNEDIVKTAKAVDSLIERHGHVNTLIHTASYRRAEDIAKASKYDIAVPRTHAEVMEVLQKKGAIVASPSVMEGIDGKDDLVRLNIIAKLPYPSLADPRMKYLCNVVPEVYALGVARNIVQACGRGTRHEEDHSWTYIIDGAFAGFFNRNKHIFPLWFRYAIVRC